MHVLFRSGLTLLCFLATFYFVYWMGGAFMLSIVPAVAQNAVSLLLALVVAGAVAVFIWKSSDASHAGLGAYVLKGAFIVGGIGFVAGFFGPMLFAPGANQGPLLGLFVTGPLGFLLGAVGGGLYWATRVRPARQPDRQA